MRFLAYRTQCCRRGPGLYWRWVWPRMRLTMQCSMARCWPAICTTSVLPHCNPQVRRARWRRPGLLCGAKRRRHCCWAESGPRRQVQLALRSLRTLGGRGSQSARAWRGAACFQCQRNPAPAASHRLSWVQHSDRSSRSRPRAAGKAATSTDRFELPERLPALLHWLVLRAHCSGLLLGPAAAAACAAQTDRPPPPSPAPATTVQQASPPA